jgi:serine/threonine protein kinase
MGKYGDWNKASEEPISEGFFGEVFEVWDYAPGTNVVRKGALKVLLDPDHEQSVQSIKNEIQTYASLNCSQIPRFLETGMDSSGVPWLVVEFVEGKTLQKLVKATGPLSREETLAAGKQLCQALMEAHGKGLKHLDIKADNMMQRNSGDWVLLDFGLSTKQFQRGIGIENQIYSAPEQFDRRNTITPAADIFSLGATLYFGLTGQNPYDVYSPMPYKEAVQVKGPSLSQAPEDLRDLIGTMMHMKPEHRPTANEVHERISSLLSGAPTFDWHPDRIKTWGQLSDLIASCVIRSASFRLSLTQPGDLSVEISVTRTGASWAISFGGEAALGRVISPAGKASLGSAKIRMSRDGNFESILPILSEELPDLMVQIIKHGLEFSLAELSYKVAR